MELTIDQALQQGIAAHKEGRLQDAERLYRTILQTDPVHPDANHNLGVLAVSLDKSGAALPFFKTALEANPGIEQFWLSYINALIKEKQFDNAEEVIGRGRSQGVASDKLDNLEAQVGVVKRGTKGSPSPKDLNRLSAYYQQGLFGDAEILAVSIIKEFPQHQFGWKVLGAVLKKAGKISDALKVDRKSLELAPQDAEAHYNLGNTLKILGRLEEAKGSYLQAIKHRPNYAQAHSNLGVTFQELGSFVEAEASFKQAISFKPDYIQAYTNLGITLHELGRLEEAVESYREAIKLKSDLAEAHYNLGNTLQELGRLEEALESYKQAVQAKPSFAPAYRSFGFTLAELNRSDAAEESWKKAVVLEPGLFSDVYDHLGSIAQKNNKFDYAEVCYKLCLFLDPNKTVTKTLSRGSILFRDGHFQEALNIFDTYNNAVSRAHALETLYAMGRIDEIYKRVEQNLYLDGENLRVAAISAFLSEKKKRDTEHKFCNNPLDFIHIANISSHISDVDTFIESVIDELRNVKTIWELNSTQKGFQANVDVFKNPSKKMKLLKSIIADELDTYYSKFQNESCSYIQKWPYEKNIAGWHVILKQQGHQTAHIHPSGWLSGVVYLMTVPSHGKNEGAIEFSLDGPKYPDNRASKRIHQPKLGDMVFFPSSLYHRTLPFSSDMERICVSFDLTPVSDKG